MSNTLRVIVSDAVTGGDDNATETIVPGTGTYTKSVSDNMANQTILPIVLITMAIIISFVVVYVVLSRIIKKKNEKKASKQPKFKTPDFAIKKIKKAGYEALVLALLLGTGGLLINHSARIEQAKAIGLSITTEDTTITVERSGDSTFAIAKATVTVEEPTDYGYLVYAYALNSSDLQLVGDDSPENKISSVNGSEVELGINSFGVTTDESAKADELVWGNVLVPGQYAGPFNVLTKKVATEAGDKAIFYYGVLVDADLPEGTYEGTVEYYVNERKPGLDEAYEIVGREKLNGYYTMQDINAEICNLAEVGSELQVLDTRDNKVYWIKKTQYGNCAMAQNLDFDLDNNVTLTHANTDLGWSENDETATWTPAFSTEVVENDVADIFVNDAFVLKSIDVGDWYYSDMANTTESTNIDYLTSPNRVISNGIITVNDGNGTGLGFDFFSTAPFETNGTHGHVGNYYNFAAAVATNNLGGDLYLGINAPNSICPAGWKLPKNTDLYSSWELLKEMKSVLSVRYFVYSGIIESSGFTYSGSFGEYWSSLRSNRNNESINAMVGRFRGFWSNDQFQQALWSGISIRCVSR